MGNRQSVRDISGICQIMKLRFSGNQKTEYSGKIAGRGECKYQALSLIEKGLLYPGLLHHFSAKMFIGG